ncbi:cutinase family protein [Gordonia sp. CPCC 206044]|uniref:cutinase family protein n=1 Tax=Gordonia sp. CPCC 206044 TaxID=3140793 RepID=UPI003AF3A195
MADPPVSTQPPATRHRRVSRSGCCAALAATALAAAFAPGVATGHPIDAASTFNLFIPGTWETDASADPAQETGALRPIADRIRHDHGDSAVVYFLPYVARAFDNGESYGSSKATAVANAAQVLRAFADDHPGARFTITGYSQGADAAGDLAAAIGNGLGPVAADAVLAVALLADPRAGTSGETTVGPRPDGVGIADPRPQGMGSLVGRVSSICDPDDLYCSIDKRRNPFLGQLGTALGKTADEATVAADEAATFATTIASIDVVGIVRGFESLPRAIADGDLQAAHEISGDLNGRLRPLVTLADAVDFEQIATVLALIPDKTGFTAAASVLARALAHVDFMKAADLVGRIQEVTWSAVGPVAVRAGAKTLPDSTPTTPADLAHLGRELASMASRVISPSAKADTEMAVVAPDLSSMATSVTEISARYAITNPRTLIHDAVSARDFYEGDSHNRYGSFIVDDQGRNAITWFADWISGRIAGA